MPTGFRPIRDLFIPTGSTWTNPAATPQTQVFYLPVYKTRNCPDRKVRGVMNAVTLMTSEASRQRLANNGVALEVCAATVMDGVFWSSQKQFAYIWSYAGGSGGTQMCVANVTGGDDDKAPLWPGTCMHEYTLVDNDSYFMQVSDRPAGLTAYAHPFDWPVMVTLNADCHTNGFADTGIGFLQQFRVPYRADNHPVITPAIAFNATNAQVKTAIESHPYVRVGIDVSVTGGPLPSPVGVTFTNGYAQQPMTLMTVATNSLVGGGSPVVTRTTAGVRGTTNETQSISTTGTVTSGTFTLNMYFAVDHMIETAGSGSTGGTPQSRVNSFISACTTNNWIM